MDSGLIRSRAGKKSPQIGLATSSSLVFGSRATIKFCLRPLQRATVNLDLGTEAFQRIQTACAVIQLSQVISMLRSGKFTLDVREIIVDNVQMTPRIGEIC